ncbi:hypothetical protein D3C76_1343460 [compost metagenome]
MRPKRRVSWFSSAVWVIGRVTSKLPSPNWSAALAKASIGWPKRRAMLCAVTKPSTSTTRPIMPSTPLTSRARSRVCSSLRVMSSRACLWESIRSVRTWLKAAPSGCSTPMLRAGAGLSR